MAKTSPDDPSIADMLYEELELEHKENKEINREIQ